MYMFIICPSVSNGGAVKPDMGKFAVVNNKPDTTMDPQIEENMDQSNLERKSTIRHVISKSFGVFFWPISKSWNFFKGFIPSPRNLFSKNKEVIGGIN
ncbi:ACYPI44554 protein [Aphis craccivora]|uniref:ACYPI44554 protein n=1 Tax=Aphis craccivora TaxID=307492 RepID=A0A6G0YT63_APHCR|nr:ACYPI44554 protein [Aphis craccivora]